MKLDFAAVSYTRNRSVLILHTQPHCVDCTRRFQIDKGKMYSATRSQSWVADAADVFEDAYSKSDEFGSPLDSKSDEPGSWSEVDDEESRSVSELSLRAESSFCSLGSESPPTGRQSVRLMDPSKNTSQRVLARETPT